MDLGLNGKVVFLTGGSGGIGATTARMLGEEGARVALTYRDGRDAAEKVAADIEGGGGTAMVVRYDLTDPVSIRAAVSQVITDWGGIDVLVACASTAGAPGRHGVPFQQVPIEKWRTELHEVEGQFHTVRDVLPTMKERGGGRIVLLSASLVRHGRAGNEGYVAAKSAIHGLSRTLATELVTDGILCNVVAPGPTVTDRLLREQLPDDLAAEVRHAGPARAREILDRKLPHLRFSTPEEVARVVCFFGSWANGNVTGDVVYVAGGR
ncbi:SDR family NAD(P)-dependent oxidoreductase [Asanoa iriomotensis]|uniref:Beta-ketoacyl-ACP reductase n=1 Tax=Asanoa iriomotensis TaxID=234613 RepID=A0ABQ4C0W6_9ACTN|nr:SDR family NAD(P)-dependent oxidoreductase [Asanoa iriomotensis]GIF56422.1 beta-ketoacyl-ACP reductase [Asanoa iriomotensis]